MKLKSLILVFLAFSLNAGANDMAAYVTVVGGSCTYPAKRMASEIFTKAGVSITWGAPNGEEIGTQPRLQIILIEGPADDVAPGALAVSHPYGACAKNVTVFSDRIRSRARRVDQHSALLAYVLVHEIAHVIQGIHRHSEGGIMKEKWNSDDYSAIFSRRLEFTEKDVQLMRHGLAVGWCHKPGEIIGRSVSQIASRPE